MRKFFLFLFLFLLPALHVAAQSAASLISLCDSIYASNPDSSFALARRAQLIASEKHDTLNLCRSYSRNARYLLLKSRLEEASEAINHSLELSEATGNKSDQAYATKLKAILQKRIGNYADATVFGEKAATLYAEAGDINGKCNTLLNLSLDYLQIGDFEKAKGALAQIAQHPDMLQTRIGYYFHQNSGKILAAEKDYTGALKEYEIAMPYAVEHKMIDSYTTLLSLIAESKMNSGDLDGAEKSLLESCRIARENKLDNELDESLVLLTDLYTRKGDFKSAFATLQEESKLNRSIYNLERVNKINELEKRLQLSEKEKLLTEKDLDIEKGKTERERLAAQNVLLSIVVIAIVVILILIGVLLMRTRNLNKRIEGQNKLIQEKSAIIEEAYTNITDSISYSKRIQNAILPDDTLVNSIFPDSFILNKAKDIVSGDFYWFEKKEDQILFAAVDCTGHGVSGAFMSIIGYNELNDAVNVQGLLRPDQILNALKKGISKALRQSETENEKDGFLPSAQVRDGMDIALCAYHPQTQHLKYAGACNPLWIIRKGELLEFSADKQPIIAWPGQELKPFTQKEIQLFPGDCIYLFSDGYADQFGGPSGKKFKYENFKKTLLANAGLPMEKQKAVLNETIEKWRGSYEQIDDILVMGIRV